MKQCKWLLVLLFAFSCQNPFSTTGYHIKGKIEGAGGQTVYLEEIVYGESTIVDTALADNSGKFTLKGNVKDEGIYRLRVGALALRQSCFLLLGNDELEIEGTIKNIEQLRFTVNSSHNKVFRGFVDSLYAKNARIDTLRSIYLMVQRTTESDSVKNLIKASFDRNCKSYVDYYTQFTDTTTSLLSGVFSSSLLLQSDSISASSLEVAKRLGNRLQSKMPESKYTKAYLNRMGMYKETLIGQPLKEIELPDEKRILVKLSSLKGKYVLLDFWASWCRPCRMENPNVVAAYQKYKQKNFTVYSVSLDDNLGKWSDAIVEDKLVWPNHVCDGKGWQSSACSSYYIESIPSNYLINPEGIIIAQNLRGEDLTNKLEELLTKKPVPENKK